MITPLIATGTPSWLKRDKITGQPGKKAISVPSASAKYPSAASLPKCCTSQLLTMSVRVRCCTTANTRATAAIMPRLASQAWMTMRAGDEPFQLRPELVEAPP